MPNYSHLIIYILQIVIRILKEDFKELCNELHYNYVMYYTIYFEQGIFKRFFIID